MPCLLEIRDTNEWTGLVLGTDSGGETWLFLLIMEGSHFVIVTKELQHLYPVFMYDSWDWVKAVALKFLFTLPSHLLISIIAKCSLLTQEPPPLQSLKSTLWKCFLRHSHVCFLKHLALLKQKDVCSICLNHPHISLLKQATIFAAFQRENWGWECFDQLVSLLLCKTLIGGLHRPTLWQKGKEALCSPQTPAVHADSTGLCAKAHFPTQGLMPQSWSFPMRSSTRGSCRSTPTLPSQIPTAPGVDCRRRWEATKPSLSHFVAHDDHLQTTEVVSVTLAGVSHYLSWSLWKRWAGRKKPFIFQYNWDWRGDRLPQEVASGRPGQKRLVPHITQRDWHHLTIQKAGGSSTGSYLLNKTCCWGDLGQSWMVKCLWCDLSCFWPWSCQRCKCNLWHGHRGGFCIPVVLSEAAAPQCSSAVCSGSGLLPVSPLHHQGLWASCTIPVLSVKGNNHHPHLMGQKKSSTSYATQDLGGCLGVNKSIHFAFYCRWKK